MLWCFVRIWCDPWISDVVYLRWKRSCERDLNLVAKASLHPRVHLNRPLVIFYIQISERAQSFAVLVHGFCIATQVITWLQVHTHSFGTFSAFWEADSADLLDLSWKLFESFTGIRRKKVDHSRFQIHRAQWNSVRKEFHFFGDKSKLISEQIPRCR